MRQRENNTEWLAKLIIKHARGMKVNILGKTFKAESNLTLGSPAILLKNILIIPRSDFSQTVYFITYLIISYPYLIIK